jgi:hypothetical protein
MTRLGPVGKVMTFFGGVAVLLLALLLISGAGLSQALTAALFGAAGASIGSLGLAAYRKGRQK